MEAELPSAPPVVAVVVVRDPGEWFETTLDALASQDYPNLRFLFLLAEPSEVTRRRIAERIEAPTDQSVTIAYETEIETRIKVRVPSAFVRPLGANPGFGPAVNEVLHLVEGDNGFFLVCHDDAAPDRDAVRLLVEELYRSNAGVVGPKLVDWDDPSVLASVGLGLDRFGEIEQPIEPGEVDQEQHDGVRDVFVVPTACMLVRADLFRELGGFDPGIDLVGEDVEFCWRVHHSGARVVVAPLARVRHRSALAERRPDLALHHVEARHRVRAVAALTSRARLAPRMLELIVLTLGELVVGLFTGRFRQAVASARAVVGLVPRIGSIGRRRKQVAEFRRVPEREVLGLQESGSARLSGFLRSRHTTTVAGSEYAIRRWRESTSAPVIAWIVVLIGLVVGSRLLIADGIRPVGDFLPLPESPRGLLGSYVSGWNPNGGGASEANPTGWAAVSVLSTLTLWRMAAFQVVLTVGSVVVGLIGLWKVATVFPSTRARITALAVYATCPLVGGALAVGSLDTLIAYAAVPWVVHKTTRAVGATTADQRAADDDVADGLLELSLGERARRTLQLGIVAALGAAFSPVVLVVTLVVGLLLAVGSLLALARVSTAFWYVVSTVVGVVVGALLNLPWIATWTWSGIVDPPPVGELARGLPAVASFEIGPTTFAYLALALYVPVVGAILLARAWRLTWAVRAGVLVAAFGALAVAADRGALPFAAPEAGILLAPVAVGVAISAAAAVAAFDLDVRGESFGWRQPLGLVSAGCVIVGLLPGVLAIGDGAWRAPDTPISGLTQRVLPPASPADPDAVAGDYNVLLVGDARLLPAWSHEYRDGISYAVVSDDRLDATARWPSPTTIFDDRVVDALDQISIGSTQRGGQLLGPLGIRFVAVPIIDGVVSTDQSPLPAPSGLIEALEEQLDLATFPGGLRTTVEIFENTAWIPAQALLTGPTAEASQAAGNGPLVRADLTGAEAVFVGADESSTTSDTVGAGVVHLAVPFDDGWRLTVGGSEVEPRRAFGATLAFDVADGGPAELTYRTSSGRNALLALQVALWLVTLFGAIRVVVPSGRRRTIQVADETLIHLDDELGPDLDGWHEAGAVSIDPGLDVTGAIPVPAREDLDDAGGSADENRNAPPQPGALDDGFDTEATGPARWPEPDDRFATQPPPAVPADAEQNGHGGPESTPGSSPDGPSATEGEQR